jgi:hypothetical protein
MGWPHRPASPDDELLRARACLGNPPRGKDPFALRSHANRGSDGHRRAATLPLYPRVQSPSVAASFPLHRLDRVPAPRTRAPLLVSHHLLWGFSPSPVPRPREEKREKRRGAPPPAPRQGDRSTVHVQEVGAEDGPLRDDAARREERSWDADAVHHYPAPPAFPRPATTTSPTQCEHCCSRLYLSPTLVSSWMLQWR